MDNISEHISYQEGIFSATGMRLNIKNDPPPEILKTMKITAPAVFEPARKVFGAMHILSFFRCPTLNTAVGGAKNSQHKIGEAIDEKPVNATTAELFHYYRTSGIDYDQVIAEFPVNGQPSWVHVSYTVKRKNRREPLIAIKLKGVTVYLPYNNENAHLITKKQLL